MVQILDDLDSSFDSDRSFLIDYLVKTGQQD